MLYKRLILLSALALGGCQTTRLTYATVRGAESVEPIFRDQVLANFAKMIGEPNSLPSQISISSGTMQTNNSITPSVTFPLSSMFAEAVAATITRTTTTAGAGATLQGVMGFQLNYIVSPITGILDWRNLRAIYATVMCYNQQPANPQNCEDLLKAEYTPPRSWSTDGRLIFDNYYLLPPICVLCLGEAFKSRPLSNVTIHDDAEGRANLSVAPALTRMRLRWEPEQNPHTSPPSVEQYIGSSGGYRFYAASHQAFADFVLTTLALPPSLPRPTPVQSIPTPAGPRRPGPASPPQVPAAPGPATGRTYQFQLVPGSPEAGQRPNIFIAPGILPPSQ